MIQRIRQILYDLVCCCTYSISCMFLYIWPCIHDLVCMTLCDFSWSCMVLYGLVCSLYVLVWSCMTLYCYHRQCVNRWFASPCPYAVGWKYDVCQSAAIIHVEDMYQWLVVNKRRNKVARGRLRKIRCGVVVCAGLCEWEVTGGHLSRVQCMYVCKKMCDCSYACVMNEASVSLLDE